MGANGPRLLFPSYQAWSPREGTESARCQGEDIDTPTITEPDGSLAVEDEPDVDPREALEKLLNVTHNAVVRRGWIVNGQPQEVWIHRMVLHSLINDLPLALEAMVIPAGSFGYRRWPGKWCAPLFATLSQFITITH